MLHELLFVLLGYSGDVFIAYPPHEPTTFAIPSSFPLLHPSERQCLDRLGQLGWTYLQIHQFIQQMKHNKGQTPLYGAYVQALVTCLDQSLDDYRQTILQMETRILNKHDEFGQGIVPLSLLTAQLSDWELVLPALVGLIDRLQQEPQQYHGCRLFRLVMDQAKTGLALFRTVLEKMMHQLHHVLYRQLTAWMIYGQLVDPDDEFFIVPFASEARWQLYTIESDRIPTHLTQTMAESILFVGKAIATVHALDRLPTTQLKLKIPMTMRQDHLQLLVSLHNSAPTHSPWMRYPQQLTEVIHQIRRSTADWLFSQVLVGDHGLHAYLNAFRHVFLLNYGDLATHFIDECHLWRRRSMSRSAEGRTTMLFHTQEVNALLIKASLGTEAEDQLDGFRLLLEQTEEYPFANLLLKHIPVVMTFDLNWPIDLFISPDDLKQYSHLWSYLISLKASQMALNDLWKLLRVTQGKSDRKNEQAVWQCRSHMLFWVDTVWSHLQIYVIDAHYQQLIEATSSSHASWRHDFEAIQAAHAQFLMNTMRGCLLWSPECVKTLYEIIKTCVDFCQLMERICEEGEWRPTEKKRKTASDIINQWTHVDTKPWIDQVEQLQETFHQLTHRFFALASNQQPEAKSSGQIDALLMQLDFNGWFSRS